MSRARRLLVPGILFTAAAAQAPGRNDPWMREVRAALGTAGAGVPGGVPLNDGRRFGMLVEGEGSVIAAPLEEGASYVVIAVCDRDCGRLGLRVTDPRRYELDADRSATRRPVLRVTAAVAGVHRFEVLMTECRVNPCRYGILLLRVPARPAPRAVTGMGLISPNDRPVTAFGLVARPSLDLRSRRGDAERGGGA